VLSAPGGVSDTAATPVPEVQSQSTEEADTSGN